MLFVSRGNRLFTKTAVQILFSTSDHNTIRFDLLTDPLLPKTVICLS